MSRTRRPVRGFVAVALAATAVLGLSIYFGVNYAVERAVIADAKDKATHWAEYFLDNMPGLDQLLADGRLDATQVDVIKAAETMGDVFRFKLFDLNGDMVVVSDEAAYNQEPVAEREHSGSAERVLATGISNISVKDGTGKQNRPPIYAEAYVPIIDDGGTRHGVVEVYLDQTGTADIFRTNFAALAVGLALITALAFGLPTLAYLFRTRQVSEARQKVEFLAHHDPLTGLLNRGAFTDRLDAALRLGSGERPAALVLFDADGFKAINETHGDAAGDAFLKHIARCLAGLAEDPDLACRPGGDEFLVALFGRSPDDVERFIEAAMQAVRQPITIGGKPIAGRLSAGYCLVDDAAAVADLLHRADVALYQAKLDGQNTYRRFTEDLEHNIAARRALEQRLREATANGGFELHFQPLLRADTRACAGFEALLRLPDGKDGYIPPAAFIPVAESIGLICEIGNWVLHEATRVASNWPKHLFVAVNLSVKQFATGRLVDEVKDALAASGLDPRQLELEVTESMLIENAAGVGAQLRALRDLGVSIAMDDFGTGYSSLGYLWQFGFDKLKIDRSFVAALDARDPRAREIVDTIIMLGHKLDMTVTAEGIETDYHASVLAELACDHFQGYLYGRPAPATEIAAFLLGNCRSGADEAAVAKRA